MAYELHDVTKGTLASVEVRGPKGSVRMGEADNHGWIVFHEEGGDFSTRGEALDCARKIVGDLKE